MLDYFDDYYLGGMDDMTSTTVECWTNLVEWLDSGNISSPWDLCPLTAAITRRTVGAVPCIVDQVHRDLQTEIEEIAPHLHTEDQNGGLRIWYDGPRYSISNQRPERRHLAPSVNISIPVPYSRFGQSMAIGEFNLGNTTQIAISSPFESHKAHVPYTGDIRIYSLTENEIVPTGHITTISPHPPYEFSGMRFGYSLASLVIAGTNLSALAVGSPGWGPAGVVHVYATSPRTHQLGQTPQLTIVPWNETSYKSRYGKRGFGAGVFVADIDSDGLDDLLISSQWSDLTKSSVRDEDPKWWDLQHGGIAVFTGQQLEMMVGNNHVLDEDCAYYITSPPGNGFGRFGASMAFAKQERVLLVGEPGSGRNQSVSGRGRVYGVRVSKRRPVIDFTIEGPEIDEATLPVEFGGGGLTTGLTKQGLEWIAIASHNEVPSSYFTNTELSKSFTGWCCADIYPR
jgi:glycosylphosphatidylinositol phospholipase D